MTVLHNPLKPYNPFDLSDLDDNLSTQTGPTQTDPTQAGFTQPGLTQAGFAPGGFGVGASATGTGTAAAQTDVLYLTEPGEKSAISVQDLYQGQIGDCFLISSFGEIAIDKPTDISNMIHANSNGTETVTLYEASNGSLPTFGTTAFKAVSVTVTNVFATNGIDNGATQDVVGAQKEIWPQVLEKAVATLNGGYAAISNGGNPAIAMEELTGKAATPNAVGGVSLASLQADQTAGDLLTFDTSAKGGLPYGLVSDHAYMFEGVTGSGSSAMVTLGNPWGVDQPAAIPFSQLSKGIVEIDVGHAA